MRIFKNICSGIGLLSIVAGVVLFIGWLFFSLGKFGVSVLSMAIGCIIDYFR